MMLLLAAVLAVGPIETRYAHVKSGTTSAGITYRIAKRAGDRHGEAAQGPAIIDGRITITTSRGTETFDLAHIVPIAYTHMLLPVSGRNFNCGAAEPLTLVGAYLAIEAIIAEKGCTAMATFIDITTGDVSKITMKDPDSERELRAVRRDPLRVTETTVISLKSQAYIDDNREAPPAAWQFILTRARSHTGAHALFALENASFPGGSTHSVALGDIPRLGSPVVVRTRTGTQTPYTGLYGDEWLLSFYPSTR